MHGYFWTGWLVGTYLVGGIPFGLLLGKLKGVDIRTRGSGNVGATNAGRVLGRKWGILCFVLDVGKGLGPVLGFGLASAMIGNPAARLAGTLAWFAIAAAAVVGHIFPIYLRFHGGKGVATGFGVLLGLFPVLTIAAVAAAMLWLAVVKASGYVSLASVVAAGSLPVLAAVMSAMFGRSAGQIAVYVGVTVALAALVVIRHRANIKRLLSGEEPKADWAAKSSREG